VATVEAWTRNGDRLVETTSDPERIRQLEEAQFDDVSNIARTRVTGDEGR
jgi:hypothetical protein